VSPNYRADHVGSLLRPPEVLRAREDYRAQRISLEQFKEIEDRAVLAALAMQRQVGIDVLTDGEFRRHDWAGDFTSSVEGYVSAQPPIRFEWKLPEVVAASGQGTLRQALAEMPQQSGRVIGERLRLRHRLTEHEVPFMKQHAHGVFKVTMPATSYVVARGWKPGITDQVYSSRWELAQDVARIMGGEVQALAAEGVPYIQIDNALSRLHPRGPARCLARDWHRPRPGVGRGHPRRQPGDHRPGSFARHARDSHLPRQCRQRLAHRGWLRQHRRKSLRRPQR